MAKCKKDITPLLTHWSYVFLVLSHRIDTFSSHHDDVIKRDGVSNHQPHDCLLSHLFRRRSMETSKLHVTGLCVGNSPVTGKFPAQMASTVAKSFHLMTSSWNMNNLFSCMICWCLLDFYYLTHWHRNIMAVVFEHGKIKSLYFHQKIVSWPMIDKELALVHLMVWCRISD